MTPEERAKWCVAQAEEIEARLPPRDDEGLQPIGHVCAEWWREMAFRVATQNGTGAA